MSEKSEVYNGGVTERFEKIIERTLKDEERERLLTKSSQDAESNQPSLSPYRAHQILQRKKSLALEKREEARLQEALKRKLSNFISTKPSSDNKSDNGPMRISAIPRVLESDTSSL